MKGAVDPNFTFPLVWDVDAIGYLLLLFLLSFSFSSFLLLQDLISLNNIIIKIILLLE